MKKTDLAYIAGIVDGEGCIGIYQRLDSRGGRFSQVCVQVNNTNEWVIRWLQMCFGAYCYHHKHYASEKIKRNREIYTWTITGKQALLFLEAIYPYLRIKKPQAEIAIAFQKSKLPSTRRLTEEEKAVREAQRIAICSLNQGKNEIKGVTRCHRM